MSPTIRECVEDAAARFAAAGLYFGHGTDNPHDEAVYLVFDALDLPFDCPEAALDTPLSRMSLERLESLICARIETRKPTAYLVNRAWFWGLPFYVDERVLIPRSPIAELIESGFSPWVAADRVTSVLDIGTGSGCIAVACAYALPRAWIDAVDNDRDALAVARRNIEAHGVGARVAAIESDLFAALGHRRYDLIIANPPYVDAAAMRDLPPEYRYEPHSGLAAGDDGLVFANPILAQARNHLNSNGILILEVGASGPALEASQPDMPLTWLEFERGGEGVCLIERDHLP